MDLRRDGPWALLNLARDHGDVVFVQIGRRSIYLLNDPAHVRHVLQDRHASYKKSAGARKVRDLLGEGLLSAEGETWRRHRRLAQPCFTKERLAGFVDLMAESTQEMLDRWSNLPEPDAAVDIHEEMMKLTLTIVARSLFSTDVVQDFERLHRAFRIAFDHTVKRLHRLIDLPQGIPTPSNLRFKEAVSTLDEVVYRIIKERRAQGAKQADDLLGRLMGAVDESGASLTDKELRDEVLTLLLGGYDTAANAMTWAWCLLSKTPRAADRLHEEARTQLDGKPPTFENLDRLAYARMVFEEAMRLYPPVWVLAREAAEDDEIGGFSIPAGSMVLMSPYVLHHDPRIWQNPEGFDPERFADEKTDRPRFAYFPFGGGPRQCMGTRFAMMEGPLILAMVAERYRLDLAPWHPALFDPSITLAPKNGMPMFISPR